MHETNPNYYPKYGVFIERAAQDTNTIPPVPLDKFNVATFQHAKITIMYRWYWDTGKDNYILVNKTNADVGAKLEAIEINMPYYLLFFSGLWPTGKDMPYTGANTNANEVIQPQQNPSPVAILWYMDKAIYKTNDTAKNYPTINKKYLRPQDLPSQKKVWVILAPFTYTFGGSSSTIQISGDTKLQSKFTANVVRGVTKGIVQNSPFVIGEYDIPFMRRQYNFVCKYHSI